MRAKLKRLPFTLLVTFLLMYMLLIFGPSEIFFANVTEFEFVYSEFGGYMAVFAMLATVVLTLLILFLPEPIYQVISSVIFGFSLAGYLQVMFLNKNLDLLGVNPEGYRVEIGPAIGNLCIWILIIGVVVFLSAFKKDIGKKVVLYGSSFLLSIQVIALVSLLLTANEDAFHHKEVEGTWHLSGEDQYKVSADENVIVIVLDYFSNQYIAPLEKEYPGATKFLHDFTYYDNMDCTYFGTFPSLAHMLTGNKVDYSCSINEWFEQIWNSNNTETFYRELQEKNYVANIYTPDSNMLCGTNDVNMLEDRLHNVINSSQEIDVFYKLLFKTMGKMSAYRMFPEALKPYFYANIDEYADVVSVKENKIQHNNYDFYQGLKEKGLTKDDSSNYFIVQHLMGPHLYTTDETGLYKENSTLEETTKGCMVIVEAYLEQLKALGVYDDATIIVTADHGGPWDSQVIFYMKEAGETHEKSPINHAPVCFEEFLPTIAEAIDLEYTQYGQSIHDFKAGDSRERTLWLRMYDENYPIVPCYTGDKNGEANVYYGYSYTGDFEDLLKQTEIGPTEIVQIVDSYF